MPMMIRDVSHVLLVPVEYPDPAGERWPDYSDTICPDDGRLEVMTEGADAFPWAVAAKVDGRNVMAPWHRVHLIVGAEATT